MDAIGTRTAVIWRSICWIVCPARPEPPVPEFHREAQQESRGCAGNFPRRESVKVAWWNLLIGIRAVTKHRVRSIINGVDV